MKLIQSPGPRQLLTAEGAERVVHLQNPKTDPRPRPPEAVVLHYTAVRAARAPVARLAQFRNLLGADFEAVDAFVRGLGFIPGALMLSLGNASKPARKASWDITIGQDGLVVQCNLQPSSRYTWHAGRALHSYVASHGHRNLFDRRGNLVYDGTTRRFASPVLPRSGEIMQSGNPPCLGIELECWGRVARHNGVIGRRDGNVFRPMPELDADDLIEVGGKLYERITPAQYTALLAACRALRDFYDLSAKAWFGHSQIVPDRRTDPEPPLDLERLVDDIYSDRLDVVALADDTDREDLFVAPPLDDNAV